MKGVILAAGKGVRMRELTHHVAKPLLPVANTPILAWMLEAFRAAGIRRALLVVGHLQEQIRDAVGDGRAFGLQVEYAEQSTIQGTGDAVLCARDFTGDEPFVLAFSDVVTPPFNFPALVREFERHRPDAILTTHWVKDPCTGAAVYVEDGLVTRLVEKPPKGTSATHHENAGIFVFTPIIYDLLEQVTPSPRGEYELTDALHTLAQERTTLRAFELQGFWSNVSSPEELLRTNRRMLVHLRTMGYLPEQVGLHHLAIADETARVGHCVVGENVSLARGSTVGEATALTWTVLCESVSIGRGATVEYAFLLPGTSLPDGATVVGSQKSIQIVAPQTSD